MGENAWYPRYTSASLRAKSIVYIELYKRIDKYLHFYHKFDREINFITDLLAAFKLSDDDRVLIDEDKQSMINQIIDGHNPLIKANLDQLLKMEMTVQDLTKIEDGKFAYDIEGRIKEEIERLEMLEQPRKPSYESIVANARTESNGFGFYAPLIALMSAIILAMVIFANII